MQTGSIVGLKRPLSDQEIRVLTRHGITKYPVMGDVYEVAFLRPPVNGWPHTVTCIVLVEFPEFEEHRVDMTANMFVELLPPLVEPIIIEEPEKELV